MHAVKRRHLLSRVRRCRGVVGQMRLNDCIVEYHLQPDIDVTPPRPNPNKACECLSSVLAPLPYLLVGVYIVTQYFKCRPPRLPRQQFDMNSFIPIALLSIAKLLF
jgi:hypothetical protein